MRNATAEWTRYLREYSSEYGSGQAERREVSLILLSILSLMHAGPLIVTLVALYEKIFSPPSGIRSQVCVPGVEQPLIRDPSLFDVPSYFLLTFDMYDEEVCPHS